MYKAAIKRQEHENSRFVRRDWGNSYAPKDSPLPDERDLLKPPPFKPSTVRRRKGEKEVRLQYEDTTGKVQTDA